MRYLIKGDQFFLLEKEGKLVILTRGYVGGTAIRREYVIPPLILRAFFASAQEKRHRKEGFTKAGKGFDPRPERIVGLNAYLLAGARYLEREGDGTFLEYAIQGDELKAREGKIDGLGKISTLLSSPDRDELGARMEALIEEARAAGYKEWRHGPSFSLSAIDEELGR